MFEKEEYEDDTQKMQENDEFESSVNLDELLKEIK